MALFPMTNAGAAFTLDEPQTVDQYFQGIRTKADFSAAFATLSEGVQYSNGLRLLASGKLSIVNASSGLPAGATFVNGLPITSDGKLCVSKNAIATWSNGIAFDAAGAVVFNPFAGASLDLTFAGATVLDPRITFTRASNATVTNSDGVIAYAPHNLLTFSEEFNDAAAWVKTNATVTVTANTTVAPDGTTTADTITAASGLGVYQNVTVTVGLTVTQSIYIKAGTATSIMFRDDNGAGRHIVFNPATGVITSTSGALVASGVQAQPNGWYRAFFTYVTDSTIVRGVVRPDSAGAAQTFILWGAQTNVGALQPYYPTTAAAYYGPRFDHDPVTLQSRGLLIEEQRTNSIRNNTMQGAVAGTPGTLPTNWIATTPANGITRQIVGTGTEDGISYIDFRFSGTNTLGSGFYMDMTFESGAIAAAQGQTWTESIYAKLIAGSVSGASFINTPRLRLYELPSFTVSELSLEAVSSAGLGSQRFAISRTVTGVATTGVSPRIAWLIATGATIDFTLRIGLPQLEQGAFATSVIPTTTAAATRAADIATMTGTNFSSWFNAAAGTLFAEWNAFGSNYNRSVVDIEQTAAATDRIDIAINSSNVINPKTVVGGSAVASLNGGNYTANTTARLAFAYASANYASSLNGAAAVTATTAGALPSSLAKMFIGSLSGISGQQINGHIRRITYFPRRLSNTELQWITS